MELSVIQTDSTCVLLTRLVMMVTMMLLLLKELCHISLPSPHSLPCVGPQGAKLLCTLRCTAISWIDVYCTLHVCSILHMAYCIGATGGQTTVYTAHSTLYIAHCTLHTAHGTLHWGHRGSNYFTAVQYRRLQCNLVRRTVFQQGVMNVCTVLQWSRR